MANPYQPSTTVAEVATPTRTPWLACAITTLALIPVWFVGILLVISAAKPIDNPAGISIYMLMCLGASAVVVPVNSFAVAPVLWKLSFGSHLKALFVHLAVGIIAAFTLWLSITAKIPVPAWTVIASYLGVFLVPPTLVGSLAFSIRYNAIRKTQQYDG